MRRRKERSDAEPLEGGGREIVVGIGASAGGLGALVAFLGRVAFHGAAFVVVQHLAPDHESMLPELLGRASTMPVLAAADGTKVEPDHVYVIPPGAELAILHGVLHVMDPGKRPHLPVDTFLRSLADDCGARAIGIVLSGTGTDGTLGLAAVKAAGGATFVQDPASAEYDGMPRSALESGAADFCLTPEGIADELSRIVAHPYWAALRPSPLEGTEGLGKLVVLIRHAFGNDLSCYKAGSIERRVARRMALQKIERLDDYARFCRANPDELGALYRDILINVTSFFRDRTPFDALEEEVLPRVLDHKAKGAPIRIWVPGCASGEEVYSIAICLFELLENGAHEEQIQIFGTDVDEDAIQRARRGAYPQSIAADVSPERLARFFVKSGKELQIARFIRESIVFSCQNVFKDPPFSRLDLVSCRNLLIYLTPATQKKVLRIFHYALNPHGFLMLGTSESIGDAVDLFRDFDRAQNIYSNKQGPLGHVIDAAPSRQRDRAPALGTSGRHAAALTLQQSVDRKVLETYGPPGVVVSEAMDVLQFRGRTGLYLEAASGVATFNLFKLARPEIQAELRRAVQQALAGELPASAEATVREGGVARPVRIDALPMRDPVTNERRLLVLFHDARPAEPEGPPQAPRSIADERIAELERELLVTRDSRDATIRDLEAANEELQASNEELQSSNEELQSTNEELDTSKEELQSINEELNTVNEELRHRMAELGATNDDLHNLLAGADTVVVIVGADLAIRRLTRAAERLLSLGPDDIGRPVGVLRAFAGTVDLERLCRDALGGVPPAEVEIQGSDHRYYLLRVLAYRAHDRSIRGAVIVFSDIDFRRRAADLTREIARYAADFLSVIEHPLMIVDPRLRVLWVNDAFHELFQTAPEEIINNPLANLNPGDWVDVALRDQMAKAFASGTPFRRCPVQLELPGAGRHVVHIGGSRLPITGGDGALVLLSFEAERGARRGE